jgi:acyl-CoA reductase-like NAD-dependent aldehyde dehydrogenase
MTTTHEPSTAVTEHGLYIAGEWTEATGTLIPVDNPATEEIIAHVSSASSADAGRAVGAARRAFDEGEWGRTSPQERREVLKRFASIMERRRGELVELNVAECGSVRSFAESGQVGGAIAHLNATIQAMDSFPWDEPTPAHFGNGIGQGMAVREGFGVAVLISAYNFPLWLNMTKLAPALAAGCTVVLKPASTTPLEGLILAEIGQEAGLPAGVLNVITGGREANQTLVTHPGVDIVSFTGSDAVGRQIYVQAAQTLKKVVLELGGKSANIITEDADIDAVAAEVAAHTTKQAGQGCSLLTRTLVHRSRQAELVEKVAERLRQVRVGNPADPGVDMGPLISQAQREKVEQLIATGKAEGATLVTGGGRPTDLDRGYYVEPTLFTDVENSMAIAQEEFFGPVNVVIGFGSDDEAVELANASPYGLSGAVHASDPVRAYSIARRLRTGGVSLNGGGGAFPNSTVPFGGYKASGLGREYGRWGIDEYLQTKAITWGVARG